MNRMLFNCWGSRTMRQVAATLGVHADVYDFESTLDEAANEQEANDKIIHDVLSSKANIFLVEDGSGHTKRHITQETIKHLRSKGVYTAFVEWNVPYRNGNDVKGIRNRYGTYPEEYDIRFFSYKGAVDAYNSIGKETIFVRKMYDGRIYPLRQTPDSKRKYDVSICGTAYDRPKLFSRKEMALSFLKNKYSLALCGKGWDKEGVGYINGHPKLAKYTMGKLPQRMLPGIYADSKVNIGTLLVDYEWYLGARPFEILGSGNFFMLGNAHESVKEIFLDNKDLVYFDSLEDLYEKVDFYLKRPDLRETIAKAGRNKVLKNFTFDKSCHTIMQNILGAL